MCADMWDMRDVFGQNAEWPECLCPSGSEFSPGSSSALSGLHHVCWTWYESHFCFSTFTLSCTSYCTRGRKQTVSDCCDVVCFSLLNARCCFLLLSSEKEARLHLQCLYPVQTLLLRLQPPAQEGTAPASVGLLATALQISCLFFCLCSVGVLGHVAEPGLQPPGHLPPHLPGLHVWSWSWWTGSRRGKSPPRTRAQRLRSIKSHCCSKDSWSTRPAQAGSWDWHRLSGSLICLFLSAGLRSHPHHPEVVWTELGQPLGGVRLLGLLPFNPVTSSEPTPSSSSSYKEFVNIRMLLSDGRTGIGTGGRTVGQVGGRGRTSPQWAVSKVKGWFQDMTGKDQWSITALIIRSEERQTTSDLLVDSTQLTWSELLCRVRSVVMLLWDKVRTISAVYSVSTGPSCGDLKGPKL